MSRLLLDRGASAPRSVGGRRQRVNTRPGSPRYAAPTSFKAGAVHELRICEPSLRPFRNSTNGSIHYVRDGSGGGSGNDVAVSWISVIAFRLRAP